MIKILLIKVLALAKAFACYERKVECFQDSLGVVMAKPWTKGNKAGRPTPELSLLRTALPQQNISVFRSGSPILPIILTTVPTKVSGYHR